MSTDLPGRLHFVEVSGSPHQIGFELGRFGARAVNEHLVHTRAWATVMAYRNDAQVRRMAEAVGLRFPRIFEELTGLAEGLDLSFEDVFAWNCRGDVWAMTPDGCTTVQVPGPRIVVAHNEDGDPGLRGACGLLRAWPHDGMGFTAFVYPGSIPGHAFAATDAGVVQTVNNIRSLAAGDGLPRMVLTRALLECPTLDEAIALIEIVPRAGAFHLTLAQAGDERLFGVEFTSTRCSVRRIEAPMLHANHLIHDAMRGEPQLVTSSSVSRQLRGDALVAAGYVTSDPLLILHDTGGEGLPIRRDDPHDPDDENTLATAVFAIEGNRLDWTVYDGTCELMRFRLKEPLSVAV